MNVITGMDGDILAFLSCVLVFISVGYYYSRMRAVDVPKWPVMSLFLKIIAVFVGVMALAYGVSAIGGIALGIGFFIAGMFFIFLMISTLPKVKSAVEVGKSFVDFTTLDSDGNEFALSSLLGKPILLVFYRGHW